MKRKSRVDRLIHELRKARWQSGRLVACAVVLCCCLWVIRDEFRAGVGAFGWHPTLTIQVSAAESGTVVGLALVGLSTLAARVSSKSKNREIVRVGDRLALVAVLGMIVALIGVAAAPGVASLAIFALFTITALAKVAPTYRTAVRVRRQQLSKRLKKAKAAFKRLRGRGIADAASAWTLSSVIPLALMVLYHATGWLTGSVSLDVAEVLGFAGAVCSVVGFYAYVVGRARIREWRGAVPTLLALTIGVIGPIWCGGLWRIWDSPASVLGKVFGTTLACGMFLAIPRWRIWFVDPAQRAGRPATVVDRALERSLGA